MIQSPGLLWTILFFVAAIGPLVFLHEMGHYLVARWCSVKADVFAIGFGREIIGWTDRRGTRWKIGWLPLGGYVRFAGDANEVSGPDDGWQKLPDAERAQTFQAKPVWKRALIVAAGPVANFLVAIVIYMALFASFGEVRMQPVIAGVAPKSAAAAAGLHVGDRILSINDNEMVRFADIGDYVQMRPNQMMTLVVGRAGRELVVNVTPREQQMVSRFGTKASRGLLGIQSPPAEIVQLSVFELPGAAVSQVRRILTGTTVGLGQIIMGYRSAKDLSGPVMIAKLSGQMAAIGWLAFVEFVAGVSVGLGFVNLLPIPMLDGGHLLFQAIEAIRRKPVSLIAQEWAYRTGFFLLVSLMLFATFNDFTR